MMHVLELSKLCTKKWARGKRKANTQTHDSIENKTIKDTGTRYVAQNSRRLNPKDVVMMKGGQRWDFHQLVVAKTNNLGEPLTQITK